MSPRIIAALAAERDAHLRAVADAEGTAAPALEDVYADVAASLVNIETEGNDVTTTTTPAQTEETTKRGRKRTVIGVATGVLMTAGIAFAVYFLLSPITGSIDAGNFSPRWGTVNHVSSEGMTCSPDPGPNGESIRVDMSGVLPGATCVVNAEAQAGMGQAIYVSGVDRSGLPAGWTLSYDPSVCGSSIETDSGTRNVGIRLTFTAPADVQNVSSFSLGGVKLSPESAGTVTPCQTQASAG